MPELLIADENDDVHQILAAVIEDEYPFLLLMQPPLDLRVVFAIPDKEGDPAVRLHGYAVTAKIAKVPYDQRVRGAGDAVMTIDQAEWADMEDEDRSGEISHQLARLEFTDATLTDKLFLPKRDMAERPVIAIRKYDWSIAGFRRVVDRHGEHAPEMKALAMLNASMRQGKFDFVGEPAEPTTVSFGAKDFVTAEEAGKKLRRTRKSEIDETFAAQTA